MRVYGCVRILGYIRIKEKKMATTNSTSGLHRDNGKENGQDYSILGSYRKMGPLMDFMGIVLIS